MLTIGVLLVEGCAASREGRERHVPAREALRPLTVIAIGDVGESNSALRGNASYLTDMYTGQHDAGVYDAMIFLGDNFYETGLNVPARDVESKVNSVLGPFRVPFSGLGKGNVHAIPGQHDWYARNALERSILFGLITISEGPVGLSEKGNKREADIPEWTYYYRLPGQACYPLGGGSQDSVQFVFFDSALLLRTDPSTWRRALDSLETILGTSKDRHGIIWRILCVHHPFYSVGEHGGYAMWDDEAADVVYLTSCDRDSNAVGYLKNWLDPEDLCATKYRQYVDSLKVAIQRSGAKIQLVLSGHDHSLQLLSYANKDLDYDGWPRVHIISGAGSRQSRVKRPAPPFEYTSVQPKPEKEGYSIPGFAQLEFRNGKLRAMFFSGNSGDPIDMGGGKKEFWIDHTGALLDQ